jgi:hypothetical protein
MSGTSRKPLFRGLGASSVTPFKPDGTLDLKRVELP